jgi:SAM-dependent methyltransferase
MDARYSYASEILKLRLRQVEEFYAPALLYIEQSRGLYEKLRWTIEHERKDLSVPEFRLLDYIYEFKRNETFGPLVDRILAIGKQLTTLISEKSGLIEGGVTPTLVEYQAHFEILAAASEQALNKEQKEGWHKLGYYPRLLNREIREGYKVVMAHLENYATAGDRIIGELLKQKVSAIGSYRRQLINNLMFYEAHASDYAAKFDRFDLSGIRQRFLNELAGSRNERRQSFVNGVARILDAGCGTGRDTYEFVKNGYAVTAIDGSPAMLRAWRKKLSEARSNADSAEMKHAATLSHSFEMTFDEMEFRREFDGAWTAASLLHVPAGQMKQTVGKLIQALKPNGILYMSFKHGHGSQEYDARFFSYYGRRTMRALLRQIRSAEEIDIWLSDAEGKDLSSPRQWRAWILEFVNRYDRSCWLNVLARRKDA